jgi:cobalamin biosynthesis protein CobT
MMGQQILYAAGLFGKIDRSLENIGFAWTAVATSRRQHRQARPDADSDSSDFEDAEDASGNSSKHDDEYAGDDSAADSEASDDEPPHEEGEMKVAAPRTSFLDQDQNQNTSSQSDVGLNTNRYFVGRRVAVYRPVDDKFYEGTVTRIEKGDQVSLNMIVAKPNGPRWERLR